jgi:histidinol-phosphatase
MMATPGFGVAWSAGLRLGPEAELEDWLGTALALADDADDMATQVRPHDLDVTAKADGSFVTHVDQAIERHIRARIADRYPAHDVVGEEYEASGSGADVRWYVDPIDGTHNFMRGIPLFGTLIAVERGGELQVGVVSAPALGRRWWARRGGRAWAREVPGAAPRPIEVSRIARLAESQLLYRSVLDMRDSRVAAGFEALLPEVWRERAYGDFWGYALVATGAAEAMMERDLHVWDVAAPWVVVEEAGGRMTDFAGRRDWFATEGLATNGLVHEAILRRFEGVDDRVGSAIERLDVQRP